ncbi:unnamed protein product, partial [Prorocentrum cordatum]
KAPPAAPDPWAPRAHGRRAGPSAGAARRRPRRGALGERPWGPRPAGPERGAGGGGRSRARRRRLRALAGCGGAARARGEAGGTGRGDPWKAAPREDLSPSSGRSTTDEAPPAAPPSSGGCDSPGLASGWAPQEELSPWQAQGNGEPPWELASACRRAEGGPGPSGGPPAEEASSSQAPRSTEPPSELASLSGRAGGLSDLDEPSIVYLALRALWRMSLLWARSFDE